MHIPLDGNIRIDGSFNSRYTGSKRPPDRLAPPNVTLLVPSMEPIGESDVCAQINPGRVKVKILGRIPHPARDVAATKVGRDPERCLLRK